MARKGEEWTVVGDFILEDKGMDIAFIERSNYGEKKINFILNKLNLDIQKLLCNGVKSISLGLGKLPVLEIIWGSGWNIRSKKQRGYRTESWRRSIYKVWTEKKKPMKELNRGHKRDRKIISISGMLRKESILMNGLTVTNTSGFKKKNDKTIHWHIRGFGWENRKSEDGIFLREKRFRKVFFRILAGEREKDKVITLIAKLELFGKD